MALVDISRSIAPTTSVWPGDQRVEWEWTTRLDDSDSSVNLGALQLSTHTASHADAPLHVASEGASIDELSLEVFVGPAEVVDVGDAAVIRPQHVRGVDAERVLFKTSASALSDEEWPDRVAAVQPDTIRRLSERGACLIGTDCPSVDPLSSTDLPAHRALIESGIVNLEGLCFENVPAGEYILIALPLKVPGADAAPVRAVLDDSPTFG